MQFIVQYVKARNDQKYEITKKLDSLSPEK